MSLGEVRIVQRLRVDLERLGVDEGDLRYDQPCLPEGEPREREGSRGRKLPPSQILQVARAPIRMTMAGSVV